ncbi:MAG: gliding motility lipoprotein GldH [Bacteroidales bacterium]|nr:gliding motility lipoprotein GldH [Bacteroidales bacterium]MDD4215722.1 gliding motility lipoprotein GldH [Bacteroidales bacterium]MDY0140329.1 gliding motility lipoprotein GldH [Bacteroidales bacterium]
MTKKIKILLAVSLMLILMSCDRNKVYEDYIKIEDGIWAQENIAKFEFEINDTSDIYNVLINLRHASIYPYNNLWLFVKSSAPNGTINIDTVECLLVNKDNRWLGDGMGDIWDIQVPWKNNIRFSHQGIYRIEFEQAMRVKNLPGVMDVGLRVEKINAN